jgi:hypothetical protein
MGVDYSAVSGYGFLIDPNEDSISELAERAGYQYEEDEFDESEFIDWLCAQYGVHYVTAGSAYDGNVCYLIGNGRSINVYWFEESEMYVQEIKPELTEKLEAMMLSLGLTKKIAYYTGLYIW